LPLLRRQLLEGKWNPDRDNPASINTWFVNLAVLCLPAPWRAWRRERRIQFVTLDPDHDVIDLRDQPDAVIYTIEFERHLEFLDPDLALMVRLDATEWEDAEIAAAVGRSLKSVEYHLAKARRTARARRNRENLRDNGTGAA
jgi:DNA-directed RNA polymerase specialized sigma24 family protein